LIRVDDDVDSVGLALARPPHSAYTVFQGGEAMRGFVKSAMFAAFSAALGLGAAVSSADVTLHSGGSSEGWKIFFPEGEGVTLVQDSASSAIQLVLTKTADFSTTQSFLISFLQDGSVAAPASSIEISNETITNDTGINWSGFGFSLLTPFAGPGFTAGHAFALPAGYTSVTPSAGAVDYTGSQAAGTASQWGTKTATGTNNLLINSSPLTGGSLQTFTFKELPMSGSSIPLPAAVWSSLSGLLALGLIANRKTLKRVLA
jgi:hypothetical protein